MKPTRQHVETWHTRLCRIAGILAYSLTRGALSKTEMRTSAEDLRGVAQEMEDRADL